MREQITADHLLKLGCRNPQEYVKSTTRNLLFPCRICGEDTINSHNKHKSRNTTCKACRSKEIGIRSRLSSTTLIAQGVLNPDKYINNKECNLEFRCRECASTYTSSLVVERKSKHLCQTCNPTGKTLTNTDLGQRGCLNPDEYIDSHTNNMKFCCIKCNTIFTGAISSYGYSSAKLCTKCGHNISAGELEVVSFLKTLTDVEQSRRDIISPLELDIFLPEFNIAIEYNGEYWHSDKFKGRNYHYNKYKACVNEGISLFQISDLLWNTKQDIIKSMLMSKLGKLPNKVYARNTTVDFIDHVKASNFYEDNHLQGSVSATHHLGLFKDEELLAVMSFKKYKDSYDLNRFATTKYTNVVGGASKLLKHFIKYYDYTITSFSDNSYSDGGLYKTLGFTIDKILPPDYKYFKQGVLYHKFGFRHKLMKNKLQNYDPTLTERENMYNNNYLRIYDSGKIKWKLN